MTTGLRRCELAGLRWEDMRFHDLTIMVRRSLVDQVVGNVKTEASQRPMPIDSFIAEDLPYWRGPPESIRCDNGPELTSRHLRLAT